MKKISKKNTEEIRKMQDDVFYFLEKVLNKTMPKKMQNDSLCISEKDLNKKLVISHRRFSGARFLQIYLKKLDKLD